MVVAEEEDEDVAIVEVEEAAAPAVDVAIVDVEEVAAPAVDVAVVDVEDLAAPALRLAAPGPPAVVALTVALAVTCALRLPFTDSPPSGGGSSKVG